MNLDLTLLEIEQIIGDGTGKTSLEIFNIRGPKAVITDYAILSGGFAFKDYQKQTLENRVGWYWTKTSRWKNHGDAHIVFAMGMYHHLPVNRRASGVRPALPFSSISNICRNLEIAQDRILEVEYGEYPQQAVSKELQKTLEELFQKRSLMKTTKKYTRDKTACNQYKQKFQEEIQEEYEYQGKKYVRVRANFEYIIKNRLTLSNGEQYKNGEYVWVEVNPIKWLIDQKNNIAITEKILFAGVQFKHTRDYKADFKNTDLKWFMDTYFAKEIIVLSQEKQIMDSYVSNYQLQLETRNPVITSANFSYEHGLNIFVELPSEILEQKEITVTVQANNNKELKKVYTLK